MSTSIVKSYIEVGNRLDRLGTSRDLLLEVVNAAVAARTECTDNDPSGSRGWRSWQMGTRRSREVHLPLGSWTKDSTDQVPSIVNAALGIRIVICNTDDGTCQEGGKPQNRSKKGAATDRAVDRNQTSLFDFFGLAEPEPVVVPLRHPEATGGLLTFYLCIFHEGDDIRAELSCAVETSGGFFESFVERIFIVGGDAGTGEPVKRKKSDDDEGGFDIPVIRKK